MSGLGLGLGLGLGAHRKVGGDLLEQTRAYYAAMNVDSRTENYAIATHVDNLVRRMQSANIWDAFDAVWIFATNDTSGAVQAADMCLINLIDPTMVGTPVNSPYLHKLSRVQGAQANNTIGGYILSGYSPDGITSKMTALRQGMGVYFHSGNTGDYSELGKMDSATIGSYIGSLYSNNMHARLTSGTASYPNSDAMCIKAGYRRNSATHINLASGKSESQNLPVSVESFVEREFFILARNNYGAGGAPAAAIQSNKAISLAYCGRDLSTAEHSSWVDIFNLYLTDIGAS
jgi:hypothetical protein